MDRASEVVVVDVEKRKEEVKGMVRVGMEVR